MNKKEFMIITKIALDNFNDRMNILAKELGITKSEADVLLFFSDNPDFCNAKDLVCENNVSKAYVSKAIGLLLEKKYISVILDKKDKRYQKIIIEDSAKEVVKKIKKIRDGYFDSLIKDIPQEEFDVFINVLNKIKKNILDTKEGL